MPGGLKGWAELAYWRFKKRKEGTLTHHHYEAFFTDHFGLSRDFYQGKRVLDLGCGPRGSLEWATMTAERIGLDPLVHEYQTLGITAHQMQYIAASSEAIPFPDQYFDLVSSFNSLDHVADLAGTIQEIKRVLKPNGYFLLLTDVGHPPTITEPLSFSWEIIEAFKPELEVVRDLRFEKSKLGAVYQSIRDAKPYNMQNTKRRYGVLSLMMRKK